MNTFIRLSKVRDLLMERVLSWARTSVDRTISSSLGSQSGGACAKAGEEAEERSSFSGEKNQSAGSGKPGIDDAAGGRRVAVAFKNR